MEGYLTFEIPLPAQLEEMHNNSIKHYNFTSSKLLKSGKCSHCGAWIEKNLDQCPECGCILEQRRITAAFNPVRYTQERAFEICERFQDTIIYRYVIGVTSIEEGYIEKTVLWEVQRNNYSGKYAIPLTVARDFQKFNWFKDFKYSDYFFGGGQKKRRTTFQLLPSAGEIEEVIEQSDARYTCVGRYLAGRDEKLAMNMYSIIAAAMRYPFCEYLWKMGLYKLYHELLHAWVDRRILTAKSIMKFRLELRSLGNPSYGQFYALWYFKKNNLSYTIEDVRKLANCDAGDAYRIHEINKMADATVSKIVDYWSSLHDDHINPEALRSMWEDELRMLMELNGYIPAKKAFPKDLRKQHNDTIELYNAVQREKELIDAEEAIARAHELEYQDAGYGLCIVAPDHPHDLVEEGAALKHCVGSYVKSFIRGETMILFLRSVEVPNIPLGTIEYRNNRVKQIHGRGNKEDEFPEHYEEFLAGWQEWINRQKRSGSLDGRSA